MTIYMCGGSSFHPYECSHDKYCEHCTLAQTDWHKPSECAFCVDETEAWVKEPFATKIRVTDLSHRKLRVQVARQIQTRLEELLKEPQAELPF